MIWSKDAWFFFFALFVLFAVRFRGVKKKSRVRHPRSEDKEGAKKSEKKTARSSVSREEIAGERMRYASPVCYAEEEDGM